QRRLETKSESGSSSSAPPHAQPKSRPPHTRNTNTPPRSNPAPPASSKSGTSKPSESKPRGPLSDEEKERRKKLNLCVYCASPKHSVADCPLVASKEAKVTAISLPPPSYPQPSENSHAQASSRTEA